ncbi:hypothetical protein PQX77_003614 [Marasmius sp. AFHP31]|nr:hypothetical protein PQX77_003614 [Marasmius sp. AFHP31]
MTNGDFNMNDGGTQRSPNSNGSNSNAGGQAATEAQGQMQRQDAQQQQPGGHTGQQQPPAQPPAPAVLPFPIDLRSLAGLPLGRDQDPTKNLTDAIPGVHLPHIEYSFSDGPFPRPTAAYYRLIYGIAASQVEEIEANPGAYRLAQFYGGGKRHRESHPNAEAELEEKLNSWGLGTFRVIKADSTVRTSKPFDGVCVAIVQLPEGNADARTFIESKRVFSWADGPHIIFHEVNPEAEAWPLMDMVSSQRLPGDQDTLDRLLVHVKVILASHPAMVAFVHQIAQPAGFLGTTTAERLAELMSTWYFAYIPSIKLDTTESAYQLRGMPLNIPTLVHRRLLSIIRDHADDFYRVGLTRFRTRTPAFKPCLMCRSESHPSHSCPYPRIPGWFGPSLETVLNWIREHQNIGHNPTRGRGRGGRGGGFIGQGRGGSRFDTFASRNSRTHSNRYDALQ